MMVGPATGGKSTWAAQDIPVASTDNRRIQMYGSLSVPGSQGSIFRTARTKNASLLHARSDAILDASHLHKNGCVRNASMVLPGPSVKKVIVEESSKTS